MGQIPQDRQAAVWSARDDDLVVRLDRDRVRVRVEAESRGDDPVRAETAITRPVLPDAQHEDAAVREVSHDHRSTAVVDRDAESAVVAGDQVVRLDAVRAERDVKIARRRVPGY